MRRFSVLSALTLVTACSDVTAPPTGEVWIRLLTTGGDPDLNGYTISIDSVYKLNTPPIFIVKVDSLIAGPHVVQLGDVASNCDVAESVDLNFVVPANGRADIDVLVECLATGVEIRTKTTGRDRPIFSSFRAKIGARSETVPLDGVVSISRLAPGNHTLELQTHENCPVAGGATRNIAVENRRMASVSFEIQCTDTERTLVFVRDSTASFRLFTALFTADSSGSGVSQLTNEGYDPEWSPDGKMVVYSNTFCDYYYYSIPCAGGLVIVDPLTRSVAGVIDGAGGVNPSWSPDGGSIAFVRRTQEATRLIVAPVGGGAGIDLKPPVFSAWHPSWAPDGKTIAFSCTIQAQAKTRICVINRDGTGFRSLTDGSQSAMGPAWSPDGATLAFMIINNSSDIHLMSPDGSNVRKLTTGHGPAWSPDGSKLVFNHADGLFTIRTDGSALTRLTSGFHHSPAWRR